MLGETVENTVITSIATPDVQLDKSILQTKPTVDDSSYLNANAVDELTKNDQLNMLTETPPLTIVPKMPVFYWEQG